MSGQVDGPDQPTDLAALRRHRATTADRPEPMRVWLYHAHVYFEHTDPDRVAEAERFQAGLVDAYANDPHVEVHALVPIPVGPHPRGSFEVLFTRAVFTELVTWLMFARPPAFSILVHPLTRCQLRDHTQRALWFGTPLPLVTEVLAASDANSETAGRSEEAIIEGTKRHGPRAPMSR
jgi:aromatic ring-cleaving dioxygenase